MLQVLFLHRVPKGVAEYLFLRRVSSTLTKKNQATVLLPGRRSFSSVSDRKQKLNEKMPVPGNLILCPIHCYFLRRKEESWIERFGQLSRAMRAQRERASPKHLPVVTAHLEFGIRPVPAFVSMLSVLRPYAPFFTPWPIDPIVRLVNEEEREALVDATHDDRMIRVRI